MTLYSAFRLFAAVPVLPLVIVIVVIVLVILFAAFVLFVADTTYKVTCYHSDEDKKRHYDPHIELGEEQYKDITPVMHELISAVESCEGEKVEIRSSRDGIKLVGHYYKFSNSPVLNIFFHGYRGTALRDGCGGFEMSKNAGYNVLLVDQRANGLSEGNAITFGIMERHDCRDWVNYAVERFGKDVKIVLSGVSLGSATVLMASGLEMPENVKCVIADCGFSSPKEIICKVAHEQGYPEKLCYPILKACCMIRSGFDLDETSAVEAVSKTKIPILIIHGDDDLYVPCEMAHKIYDACASEKELVIIHGAPHAASYVVDKETYTDAAIRFIEKHI